MLRSTKEILGYTIGASDGELGGVHDVFFDDSEWVVRYLAVDTRKWLPGRKVLIAPVALGSPNWEHRVLPVGLTKEEVRNSPKIDSERPISRRQEEELYAHYQWVPYWGGGIAAPSPNEPQALRTIHAKKKGDPHLRSVREVLVYAVHAADGNIGEAHDFVLDDEEWAVRYLVVDTHPWLPGRQVLVSPAWIGDIKWAERSVRLDLTQQQVKDSPEYDPSAPVNRQYEKRLYDYYGRPRYWG
jgi:hypothetical protein